MRQQLRLYLLALGWLLGITAKALAEEPTLTTFDFPDSTFTTARDVNSARNIVGRYGGADGNTHGYLRMANGDFTPIDFPNANLTAALGINCHNDVVGAYRLPGEPTASRHGFLLRDGTFSTFDFPDATATFGMGINCRGDIVGQYASAGVTHGFLLSGRMFTSIDSPGASSTLAWKINRHGQILGGYADADGRHHIFRRSRRGHFTTIVLPGDLPNPLETAGFTDRGDIAGYYCDTEPCGGSSSDIHGYLLSGDEFTIIDLPGFFCTSPLAINNRRDIVGALSFASDCSDAHGFLLTREDGDNEEDGNDE